MFETEKKIISRAESLLRNENGSKTDLLNEFSDLLKGYKKASKQLRRTIKISDRLQEVMREQTVALKEANSKLQQANYQLRERQNVIVKLLGDISRIKLSGDRHAMRNMAQRIFENQKKIIIQAIARQICFAHKLLGSDEIQKSELHDLCRPFGINGEIFSDPVALENKLYEIEIEKADTGDTVFEDKDSDTDFAVDDLLSDIFFDCIYFNEAYKQFEACKSAQSESSSSLTKMDFDPFILFLTLMDIRELINEMNLRFKGHDELEFVEPVKLSEALKTARQQALEEKGKKLDIFEELSFDPEFLTNKESLIFMLRDFLYNSIDADAARVLVTAKRPSSGEAPPYFDECRFEDFPSVYISLEDNGKGIPEEKAQELNEYLSGQSDDASRLTTKAKSEGGLGTKNLRDFLFIHKGFCFYQPLPGATKVHLYFEKLEL